MVRIRVMVDREDRISCRFWVFEEEGCCIKVVGTWVDLGIGF